MEEQVVRWFEEIGEMVSNQSLTRGVLVVGAASLTIALGLWKGLISKRKPEKTVVTITSLPGEKVFVQIGDDEEETK